MNSSVIALLVVIVFAAGIVMGQFGGDLTGNVLSQPQDGAGETGEGNAQGDVVVSDGPEEDAGFGVKLKMKINLEDEVPEETPEDEPGEMVVPPAETGAPEEPEAAEKPEEPDFVPEGDGVIIDSGKENVQEEPAGSVCSPGERRCNGDNIELCSDDGSRWMRIVHCGDGCNDDRVRCMTSFNYKILIFSAVEGIYGAVITLDFRDDMEVAEVNEGAFLDRDGWETSFSTETSPGKLVITMSRLASDGEEPAGARGSGSLAEVDFSDGEWSDVSLSAELFGTDGQLLDSEIKASQIYVSS